VELRAFHFKNENSMNKLTSLSPPSPGAQDTRNVTIATNQDGDTKNHKGNDKKNDRPNEEDDGHIDNDEDLISEEEYNAIIIEYAEMLEGWSNPIPPKVIYKTLPDATQVRFQLSFWQRLYLFLAVPMSRYSD
jgi:hypothetical protein